MAAQSNDSSYPSCLSYNCANITISYPFWRIHGETPTQYCGYEGFGINCSNYGGGPEIPIAYLGNDSYYAHNISYESKSIILVDYDVAPVVPVDDCPRYNNGAGDTVPWSLDARIRAKMGEDGVLRNLRMVRWPVRSQ
ncbi:hypothetical protein L2E82_50394 [Cichorium intybus]|nr:hypothetical protein L2E82_50394 [Cichorium intybus]